MRVDHLYIIQAPDSIAGTQEKLRDTGCFQRKHEALQISVEMAQI